MQKLRTGKNELEESDQFPDLDKFEDELDSGYAVKTMI